jgi:hypothetical protein
MSALRRAVEKFLLTAHPTALLNAQEREAVALMKAALVPLAHSPAPWRPGLTAHAVVSDGPPPEGARVRGDNDVHYYGGHLVAESIAPANVPVIVVAPEAIALLRELTTWWQQAGAEYYGTGRRDEDGGLESLCDEAAALLKRLESLS